METNELVVDKAFDHVECTEANQHRADKEFVRPVEVASVRVPPKDEQAGHDEKVGAAVKDTIPEGIEFKVFDGVDGIPTAEHVVPLQNLVQNDSVEKTAKAQTKQNSGQGGKYAARSNRFQGHLQRKNLHPKQSSVAIVPTDCLISAAPMDTETIDDGARFNRC